MSDAPRAVVLVEGTSDKLAVQALARRRGRDLEGEGVSVVAIGGAQAIGNALVELGPTGRDLLLAGLCDSAEEPHFSRALERAGLGSDLTRRDLEALGFFVCESDLEEELVRALGAPSVERLIEEQGELQRFHTFQKQVAKRGLTLEAQLHGFMWNRKIRYARLLVEALDLERVPRPLDLLLAHVA